MQKPSGFYDGVSILQRDIAGEPFTCKDQKPAMNKDRKGDQVEDTMQYLVSMLYFH